MTTDTHKKPASGVGDREAFELFKQDIANRLCDIEPPESISELRAEYWKAGARRVIKEVNEALVAALRYRDELAANRKCDCTFICKFCRERRDELEKVHE